MNALGDMPELRPLGPLETLDRAFAILRKAGARALLSALFAGFMVAVGVVAVYYVERVEGIRGLRPLLAAGLLGVFLARTLVLSRLSAEIVRSLRPTLPIGDGAGSRRDTLRTGLVVGWGLWFWLWPLAGLLHLSPFAPLAMIPLLALRGAVAPSWLARSGCAPGGGVRAFGQAFDDTAGARGAMYLVELLLLVGAAGLFFNLYGLVGVLVMLGHSMLGLDVAFVSSFVSPDNGFTLLLSGATSLVLLEPLRMAVSAQAYVDARSRRDGADLHAAVDAAIAARARVTDSLPRSGVGAASALLLFLAPLPCQAQQASQAQADRDAEARQHVGHILERPEFRDFAQADYRGMSELLDSWFEKLRRWLEQDEPQEDSWLSGLSGVDLPMPAGWLLMLLLLVVTAIVLGYVLSQREAPRSGSGAGAAAAGPQARAPAQHLDDAASLAAQGKPREALRALYLATLVALDRGRHIHLEPGKTNGQYLRSMSRGPLRQDFTSFTRVFDRKWYGDEPATLHDYEQCRALADRICGQQGPS